MMLYPAFFCLLRTPVSAGIYNVSNVCSLWLDTEGAKRHKAQPLPPGKSSELKRGEVECVVKQPW